LHQRRPFLGLLGLGLRRALVRLRIRRSGEQHERREQERARAEAQAKEEVRSAVAEYCNAQPNAGIGLQICSSLGR